MIHIYLSKHSSLLRTQVYFLENSAERAATITYPEAGKHPSEWVGGVKELVIFVIKEKKRLNIITHSKELINVVGDMIEDGEIESSDVVIKILNQDNTLQQVTFDKEGDLDNNWPIGFFTTRTN